MKITYKYFQLSCRYLLLHFLFVPNLLNIYYKHIVN